nr:hypothetical protein MSCUHULR_MSCUHULR_CDS_0005 [Microvirus sp.]
MSISIVVQVRNIAHQTTWYNSRKKGTLSHDNVP